MVQDQLVSYISSQLKEGVTEKAIKTALISAGWQATDVEDTFKKVSAPSAQPSAPAAPVVAAKPAMPSTTLRVSDLISAPESSMSTASSASANPASKVFAKPAAATAAVSTAAAKAASFFGGGPKSPSAVSMPAGGKKKFPLPLVIGGVVILALLGLSGYLYYQNTGLTQKVASLGTVSTSVSSQIASLNSQVVSLNETNKALVATSALLSTDNTELLLELSGYAIPPGGTATTAGPVTLSGTVAGGAKYSITTAHGAKIFITNGKDAKVAALLAPLVGTTTQISGTYIPGSDAITVSTVNGTSTTN